jgi:hypothetical protein
MAAIRPATTFIVRLDESEALSGVVERVRTGEKHRFEGVEALGALIRDLAAKDRRGSEEVGP